MNAYLRIRAVVDRVIAAIALIILSPLTALLGQRIHRHDQGPRFVAVPRTGKNGETFNMWKLRSMKVNPGGSSLTSAKDDRITPVGHTLRKYHLDEIPQLWNVVRGEMTLLGPRPEAPDYVDQTSEQWRQVLAAAPGIAGPTQLVVGEWELDVITKDQTGTAYRDEVLPVKLAIDAWYVRNASIVTDLRVGISLLAHLAGKGPGPVAKQIRAAVPAASKIAAHNS